MQLDPGQIIDAKYRVVRRIGEGGMGTVYEGENSRIGRRVAIKVLHAQVASMPEFVERFEREARAAARIGSPHVCDVLDLGDLPNGDRYIVMEYLDGISFEDRLIERTKLSPAELAPIAFELLEGLGTMHVARVIHRDLKPANVFIARTPGGRGEMVKILDFGVAKLLPFAGEVGTMTQTGTMMGTPLYMSPEQARGARDVDGRTDIYAASVMFYRALAGVLPYNADTLNELLFKIVLEDPKPLRDVAPEIDETFAAIIHKGLARDIDQRFQTAREYQAAIAGWGKAQGRNSLSFASTIPSEPPPRTPITLPEPATAEPLVANAVTAANAGTPIAWSEDSAKLTKGSQTGSVGGSAHGPAASASNPSNAAPLPGTTPIGAAAPSGATLASSEPALANATTAPVSIGEPSKSPAALGTSVGTTATTTAEARPRAPRGVLLGVVGAGAIAIVAIVAFGRGTGAKPTPAGMSPISSGEAAPADPTGGRGPAAKDAPTATASGATVITVAADAGTTPTTPPDPTATIAAPGPRHDTGPSTPTTGVRKLDPSAKSGTASTPAAAPATTTTASTAAAVAPASAAAPKPAGSARKFRTNLD